MHVAGTFSELLAPGLDEVFHRSYNEVPEMWPQFFNTKSSNKAYEEHFNWAPMTGFAPYGELEEIELREAKPGFTVKYVHRKFGAGYKLSQELVDDNQYTGVLETFPQFLGRAARTWKETVAASIFNLGFSGSQLGGDGVPLFSTAHPLQGYGGGTTSNTTASPRALSHTALKDVLVQMKRTVDDKGDFAPVTPTILLVPDQLEFKAREILGTDKVPYSADNTTNVLRDSGLQIVSWSYLTSEDDWFLLAPKAQTKLTYFERWPLRQHMEDVILNQSMYHIAYERYSFGFSDHYGTFGVQGS